MFPVVNLGGTSPMGPRARLRNPIANPVRKIGGGMGGARLAGGQFQRGAAPAGVVAHGGGGGGRRRRHGGGGWWGGGGGWWPYYYPYYYPTYAYYPYLYPYSYSPSYYGYGYDTPTYSQTVPSSCCYDVDTGSLYCPGSEYDGAPAYAEATREYQGRQMSYVTSPRLGQAQWFWNCPPQGRPSLIANPQVPSRVPSHAPSMLRFSPRIPSSPHPRRSRLR